MRNFLAFLLVAVAASAAGAAITAADSPAARQAESLLSSSGDTVYDGNSRSAAPLAVRSGDRAMDDESTVPGPGPRVGPGPSDLGEPANPAPKAEEPSSGGGSFLSRISWKQVGFGAAGALLGVGLGMLLGWGWLGIAALAVGAAVAGYFLPKLFS